MPELRLGVDLHILDRPGMELSGIGRYAVEVTHALERARPRWQLLVHSDRRDLLRLGGSSKVIPTRWPTRPAPGRIAWVHLGSAASRARKDAEAWFSPSFVLPAWWRRPSIVAVHDLAFELMPERYRGRLNARYAAAATRFSARRADRVLCGSRETKDGLTERWGIEPDKVSVTPYGVSEPFLSAPQLDPRAREDFILFVGSLEARKGLETLHGALRTIEPAAARPRLVLAGKRGWGVDRVLAELLAAPEVEFVEAPDDRQLASLYRTARMLVFPSRLEGFGLPVAEAMASGCPVIASDLACIHEFAGAAVAYTPPGDSVALRREIEALSSDRARQAELGQAGHAAARSLTWDEVGERTAEEIERAVANARATSARS